MNTTDDKRVEEKRYAAKEGSPKNTSQAKTKKGLWSKYTDRLKNTRCTRTSQECE